MRPVVNLYPPAGRRPGNDRERPEKEFVVVVDANREPVAVLVLNRELAVSQPGRQASGGVLDVRELADGGELADALDVLRRGTEPRQAVVLANVGSAKEADFRVEPRVDAEALDLERRICRRHSPSVPR